MSRVFLSPRFHEALDFAALGHRSQPRKGTEIPYIVHPVAVACLVDHYGGDEEAVIAGLVHDLPEDTDVAVDQIRSAFGERVARIVGALTENKSLPWVMRKRNGLAKYRTADDSTRLVAGADKLTALIGFSRDTASGEDSYWDRFNVGKPLQAWYYHSASQVFASLPFADEFRRLTAQVFEPEASDVNPCAMYVEYALRKRGKRALNCRLEARNLWLNVEQRDQQAMAAMLNSLIADKDGETAAQAAAFLGFAGKASTFADQRLIFILENETRRAVLAAALVATEVILNDAMEGDKSLPPLLAAREKLRSDTDRAAAVINHLTELIDEDSGYEFQNALRFLRGTCSSV